MHDSLEIAVAERLELIQQIKQTFQALYPEMPEKLRPGSVQNEILETLHEPLSGTNKRTVYEALKTFGYVKVKNQGFFFYRKRGVGHAG